jgi:predicted peroxiredoxin
MTRTTGEVRPDEKKKLLAVLATADGDDGRTLHDFIREAHAAGVTIKVCTPNLEQWGTELIAKIDETVGSSYLVGEVMDKQTVTLTY